jgi:hypothetical protein
MTEHNHSEIISPDELKTVMAALFKRAQTDADFRKLCLENPHEAIYQMSGKRVPADATLNFIEPKQKTLEDKPK